MFSLSSERSHIQLLHATTAKKQSKANRKIVLHESSKFVSVAVLCHSSGAFLILFDAIFEREEMRLIMGKRKGKMANIWRDLHLSQNRQVRIVAKIQPHWWN